MDKVYEVIKQLQNTTKRTEKESILRQHKSNETLKRFLYHVYNPYLVYGIKDKKLKKFMKQVDGSDNNFNDIFHVFDHLKQNNTGTDNVIKRVAEFIQSQEEHMKEFYQKAITKSLKTGCTATTYNKVFGKGFIPQFKVMLAKKFEDHEHKVEGKFVLTEKLDGMRVVTVVKNGEVKLFSRQGQELTGFTEIEEDAAKLPDNVYDGEVLIKNHEKYKDRDVLQETLKIARKDGEKTDLTLHLFDVVPVDEFKNGKSKKKFIERKEGLKNISNNLSSKIKHIQVVPNKYVGDDKDVIPELLQQMNDEGKEGLMLNKDVPYQCKRSDAILKLKTMNEVDVKITGYEEGTGKYEGMLGAFIVDFKGNEVRIFRWATRRVLR